MVPISLSYNTPYLSINLYVFGINNFQTDKTRIGSV
jgi:hypothetical protein